MAKKASLIRIKVIRASAFSIFWLLVSSWVLIKALNLVSLKQSASHIKPNQFTSHITTHNLNQCSSRMRFVLSSISWLLLCFSSTLGHFINWYIHFSRQTLLAYSFCSPSPVIILTTLYLLSLTYQLQSTPDASNSLV